MRPRHLIQSRFPSLTAMKELIALPLPSTSPTPMKHPVSLMAVAPHGLLLKTQHQDKTSVPWWRQPMKIMIRSPIPSVAPMQHHLVSSARLGSYKQRQALDYETKTSYSVEVSVSDSNEGTDSITVTINVTDVNEAPQFH